MAMVLLQKFAELTKAKLALANATAKQVLLGSKFYAADKTLRTGTMPNRGGWKSTLAVGKTVTIPEGYHDGTGAVTQNPTLAGNVWESAVLEPYTFYSGDATVKRTGSMKNRGAVAKTLNCGEQYTVPEGYHSGAGVITANSLFNQTRSSNALDSGILSGMDVWWDGTHHYGNMVNNADWKRVCNAGQTITIPQGYHNGAGFVISPSITNQIKSQDFTVNIYGLGNSSLYSDGKCDAPGQIIGYQISGIDNRNRTEGWSFSVSGTRFTAVRQIGGSQGNWDGQVSGTFFYI